MRFSVRKASPGDDPRELLRLLLFASVVHFFRFSSAG